METLSLVLPAYNEADVIAQAIAEAEVALSKRFRAFEVLVVDDGSTDATAAVVAQQLRNAPHSKLIRHGTNRGYGAALRTGFEATCFPLIAFTDADCQFDLTELGTLAEMANEYPVVVGYRVDRKDPGKRRFFSWGYNLMARTLLGTGVRDVDCALKVFRRGALAQLLPESNGFFVNTEMMTRARQARLPVMEVPVTHRPRAGGQSKVSLREIPPTAARLLRFWWSNVLFAPKPKPAAPVVLTARVRLPIATPEAAPGPLASSESGRRAAPRERRRGVA